MSVGAAIYARRLEKGLTQRELARRAVMTPANLSAIETGRRDLLVSTLLRIARCLDVPAAGLIEPHRSVRTSLPRRTIMRIARAVVDGRRPFRRELNELADAVAWNAGPILAAVDFPGAKLRSRRAARLAPRTWSGDLLDRLFDRVQTLAGLEARRQSRNPPNSARTTRTV